MIQYSIEGDQANQEDKPPGKGSKLLPDRSVKRINSIKIPRFQPKPWILKPTELRFYVH
jgi:hypothetical protein